MESDSFLMCSVQSFKAAADAGKLAQCSRHCAEEAQELLTGFSKDFELWEVS